MKATLDGTYAGSGGKQAIKIQGNLSVEGLNVTEILEKLCELEGKVSSLQETVSRLQEQSMHSSVGQLAKALETIKEAPVEVPDASVVVEEPAPTPTQKKKSAKES